MKKLLLLFFGILAALPAMTQVKPYVDYYEYWKFFKGSSSPVTWEGKFYQRVTIEHTDTSTYVYTLSRVKKVWPVKDTVRTSSIFENDNAAVVKVNMSQGSKTGVSGGTFHFVTTTGTLASAKLSFTGDGVEFDGERFSGHGNINILIDGVSKGTFNQGIAPFVTDFSRGVPTFKIKLPLGPHTIEVNSTSQFIVDYFKVTTYTLQ